MKLTLRESYASMQRLIYSINASKHPHTTLKCSTPKGDNENISEKTFEVWSVKGVNSQETEMRTLALPGKMIE